ncbi:hypothetical protein L0664_13320 [Octadecabacter sp. G9-8]|uniref:Biopolymer transporter ExbD n=1 Tax=Octadecabacter dasysiphoniae TaxID=2909341 RepID=A0ABS9CZ21_9RHOB|nr:hypothetical protein [Octadecabacter dasysiphoniae]MCF2872049.1 hypothetical protein [Octadecabacter dasysiphoniae]
MRISRTISHGASYTALVDILFATIGVFVIVFALQDVQPPQDLQPAPYAHLVLCEQGQVLSYLSAGSDTVTSLAIDDLDNGRLEERLMQGGRVLVALAGDCVRKDGANSIATLLTKLETTLSARPATGAAPLTLFEFSPLGQGEMGADVLRQRFLDGGGA